MVDYSKPITDGDIKKAKTWYDIVCWGGLLIVLLPVGIANLILGYLMGDSPCTLCWGQREQMAFIGVVALHPSAILASMPLVMWDRALVLKSWDFTLKCGRKSSSGVW